MKRSFLILLLAASTAAAIAQTPAKPANPAAKHKTTAASHTMAAKHTKAEALHAMKVAEKQGPEIKVTDGLPKVPGVPRTMFQLRYKDVKIGTGPEAVSDKLYTVQYTGWIAATGRKFDSSYDHPRPPIMKDGKPVMGPDGKPLMGPPQPIRFPQGFGRVIPGFDQGFAGMHVGGVRILYIPWQLGYGARGRPGPDAQHPGIPPYADLVFEVQLMDVSDMPTPHYGPEMMHGRPMPGMHGMHEMPGHPMPEMHPMPDAKPAAPEASKAPAKPATPATAPATPAKPESK